MWLSRITAVAMLFIGAAAAPAQVIYEPVQSQYRTSDGTFYYGGNNPRALEYATRRSTCFQHTSQSPIGSFGSGYLHRKLISEPAQYTVSDCAIYRNAAVFGYTSVDARNDAYANVPRFFRMTDLSAAAVPAADGLGLVVPAQPARGNIVIRAKAAPATQPATQPRPIIIIPKPQLDDDRIASLR